MLKSMAVLYCQSADHAPTGMPPIRACPYAPAACRPGWCSMPQLPQAAAIGLSALIAVATLALVRLPFPGEGGRA